MIGPKPPWSDDPTGTRLVAFLAPTGLTGRTQLVSNLAWMLARAGRRVLVVDAGRGAARVDEHLRMFRTDEWPVAEKLPAPLAALLPVPSRPARQPLLRRYAAAPGRLDVVWIPEPVGWIPTDEPGDAARNELRRQLRATEYDVVLLDPIDSDETVAYWAAVLCEVVAICYPYRRPRLPEAVELGRKVRRAAPVWVRLVAVGTGMDEPDAGRVAQHREHVRRAFRAALDTHAAESDLALVEVPGGPNGQPLAPLAEESPYRDRLLAAYDELALLLTDDDTSIARPEPEAVRLRYLYGLGRQPADDHELLLAHPAGQRAWADWLAAELATVGVRVRPWCPGRAHRVRVGAATLLAVVPADGSEEDWLTDVLDTARAAGETEPFVVRTGSTAIDHPLDGRPIDLTACSDDQARQRLRGALGLADCQPLPLEGAWQVGFPGGRDKPPQVFNLPERARSFVGRDREIDELRDLLLAGPGQPVVVHGPAAAGKTSTVREYVARFWWDYDLIVWIPAADPRDVRWILADVAHELGVEPRGNPAQEMLGDLGHRSGQWLVVYDGADGGDLAGLLPTAGAGHLIVTRREAPDGGPAVSVAELNRSDAVRLLTEGVAGLSAGPAADVVAAVGALPLDLRLASGLLAQAGVLLTTRRAVAESRAADTAVPTFCAAVAEPGDEPPSVRVLRVALALMRERRSGRAAVAVAQMCAFASPLGLSLSILQSRSMRAQIARGLSEVDGTATHADGAVLHADGWELDRALATAVRFRLLHVVWGRDGTVRMHPAVQATVLAAMTESERASRRAQFLRGLADTAPSSAAADSPINRELYRHLVSSQALTVDEPDEVRRWLVEQLENLIKRGETEAAEALPPWRVTLDRWLARYGWDRLTLRLATRLADVTRLLGRSAEALELSRVALREGAALLGPDHPSVLVTRRGLAGDLRGLGQFRAALVEDQATWRGFRDQFGNDHPETLIAAHNLAYSFHLAGRSDEALEMAQRTRRRRLRLFPADHPDTLWLVANIGSFLCELGELTEAGRLLNEARQRRGGRARGDEDLLLVRIVRNLAVTERRTGRPHRARDLNGWAYPTLSRLLGADSPATRSCRLSVAIDYHLGGETGAALPLAEESIAGYERDLGLDHPYTRLGWSVRSVLLRELGQREEAVAHGEQAATALAETLGQPHPWALGALVNQAGNLAEVGEAGSAEQMLRAVVDQGRDFLGPEHPCLRTARRLLAAVVSQGEVSGAPRPGAVPFDFVDLEVQ
ncbi:FxSxx-COOH system tetratricopeptide repeat protein [Micromonospora sp. WMMD882]|uniref:FxSxx-COOH system tetratricopeptide repeat protein n=1 Tax=Micromonospora sp. WMMD882 TaxID=3015151 RepID=UPI00248AAA02|nr:FxSxx-COOH system tetratricopeptide repeat protein [Micromonospora sp. WMMD882]WBB77395.1 FxSxx-COOH system tetratricopeptide repeat protein [Micromonospora sp. WMMD882]